MFYLFFMYVGVVQEKLIEKGTNLIVTLQQLLFYMHHASIHPSFVHQLLSCTQVHSGMLEPILAILGRMRDKPWTSLQFIAGPTRIMSAWNLTATYPKHRDLSYPRYTGWLAELVAKRNVTWRDIGQMSIVQAGTGGEFSDPGPLRVETSGAQWENIFTPFAGNAAVRH